MTGNRSCFLWALCLALLGAWSYEADASPALTSEALDITRIKDGLDRVGVGEGYEIVVADERDVVEDTAAEMMQRFLAKASLPVRIVTESQAGAGKRFLLGRETNLRAIKALGDKGDISIRDVSEKDDGFHLKRAGQDIVVAGANPRGVLYGVYAFEDFIRAGARGALDIKKVPYYRKRGSGLYYTHVIFGMQLEAFPEAKAAYLSRLGINEMTDQGIGGPLTKFVKSDDFPFQTPPNAEFQHRLKDMSALCRKYGIDVYVFLIEPTLEPVSGGFESYPEEALGTARPPWGGGKDGLVRTLCVSSPLGQKYLRNMITKLVREYPEVKGVNFYNLDVGSWLCTPALCERCKRVCTDSPPDECTPWETQAKVVTLLAEAAHKENPDFDFRFWGTAHYYGERFDKMIHATEGYDGLLSAWSGEDRTVMVPDSAERAAKCILSQNLCRERDVPFYMLCEFNNLEAVPKSLPFPFHVCDALKKFKRWDVRNLTEIFGIEPEHNPINALLTKEFEWNPEQNTEEFLADLSVRQFGKPAGDLMYRAWAEMKKAFDVWNDNQALPSPLAGSQYLGKMGTAIGGLPLSILPEAAIEKYNMKSLDVRTAKAFLDLMKLMNGRLAQAADDAKRAITAASDKEFIDLCYYEGENGRPTCRQYAELNYAPIAIADALCLQRCNTIRAYLLLAEIETARAAGEESSVREKEKQYQQLVREDIGVQERFCELLTEFSKMKPCFTRTSLTEQEIADFLSATRAKIGELKAFLDKTPSPS